MAIGGDGTVHEVANGIRGSSKRMGIIPMGNGDDFARALGIPLKDLNGAIDILSNGSDYTVGGIRVEASRHQTTRNTLSQALPVTGEPSRRAIW